jgi:hypothetical protein
VSSSASTASLLLVVIAPIDYTMTSWLVDQGTLGDSAPRRVGAAVPAW